MPQTRNSSGNNHIKVELSRGTLELDIKTSSIDPEKLLGFAERKNPKRAFLFVSRVLGRHIPVSPSIMQQTYLNLAKKIPINLPGPVLVLALAETAVGLGAGVYREYSKKRDDTVFLTSTRHALGTKVFTLFEEEHSHATAHLIHQPLVPEINSRFMQAQSIILVDDESSTGNTFINLMNSLEKAGLKDIKHIITVTLTDWSDGAVTKKMGHRVSSVSLLEGKYKFYENINAPIPIMPNVNVTKQGYWPINKYKDWGRLGRIKDINNIGHKIKVNLNDRILIIGTNEFVWKPFLLAEQLEKDGANVLFCSTTRSPIELGLSIKNSLSFKDNYGLGITNFLYNVNTDNFDRIIIYTETPIESVDPNLISALGAEVISDA